MMLGMFWVPVGGGGYILGSGGQWWVYFGQWWVVADLFWVVGLFWAVVGSDGFFSVVVGGCRFILDSGG